MIRIINLTCIFIVLLFLTGCNTVQIHFPVDKLIDEMAGKYPVTEVDYDDFNLNSGTIFLNGDINIWKATRFQKEIMYAEQIEDISEISVYMSSSGGDAEAMEIICNAVQFSIKKVDVIVTGYCMSSACKILQCATGKRLAYPAALFGLHAVRSNNNYFRDSIEKDYVNAIRKKSRLPESFFPLTDRLIFFNAEEALEYCFIDGIIVTDSEAAPQIPAP